MALTSRQASCEWQRDRDVCPSRRGTRTGGRRELDDRRFGLHARSSNAIGERRVAACPAHVAAVAAHEAHRVLLLSCTPASAGHLAAQYRPAKAPSAFSCLFAPFPASRQNRIFAGISDGETRTRTGDTTIFSRYLQSGPQARNPWKPRGFGKIGAVLRCSEFAVFSRRFWV
jgi:hypothetical protein